MHAAHFHPPRGGRQLDHCSVGDLDHAGDDVKPERRLALGPAGRQECTCCPPRPDAALGHSAVGIDARLGVEPVLAAAWITDNPSLGCSEREVTAAARITATADDGRMTHAERLIPGDLGARHFGVFLTERLRWALHDHVAPGEEVAMVRRRYRDRLGVRAGVSGSVRSRGERSSARARALAWSW
jgi:hypothetical protein